MFRGGFCLSYEQGIVCGGCGSKNGVFLMILLQKTVMQAQKARNIRVKENGMYD